MTMTFSDHDRTVLRETAKRLAEAAAEAAMETRRRLWLDHNSLRRVRPMVLVFPEGAWAELLPDTALQCEGHDARRIEWNLRHRLYTYEHFDDDTVLEADWPAGPVIESTGWGLEEETLPSSMARGRLPRFEGAQEAVVIEGDSRQLDAASLWREVEGLPLDDFGLPQFDFIMTSPPYWNMLGKSRGGVHSTHKERMRKGLDADYGEHDGNLEQIADYNEFIEEVGSVFDNCARLLAPNKYLVVVMQNVRVPDGHVQPLARDLARRISETLSFQGERIWCQDSKKLGIWGYPTTFVPNYHHHYCLIFRQTE